jgi:hypothetical protein
MVLTFRQLSFDTAHFSAGSRVPERFSMFEANPGFVGGKCSVMDFDEHGILKWLVSYEPSRSVLLEELGRRRSAFVQTEVVQPFYAPGQGDIDFLACDRDVPQQALIMEAKRVEVEVETRERDVVRKLRDVAKGVQQANTRYDHFGFFQHYLAVITAVDASEQNENNVPSRGLRADSSDLFDDRKTFTRIVDFPRRDDLKPDVGVVFIEVVQPSRLGVDLRGTLRICVHRRARPREHSADVTNRVATLMSPVVLR